MSIQDLALAGAGLREAAAQDGANFELLDGKLELRPELKKAALKMGRKAFKNGGPTWQIVSYFGGSLLNGPDASIVYPQYMHQVLVVGDASMDEAVELMTEISLRGCAITKCGRWPADLAICDYPGPISIPPGVRPGTILKTHDKAVNDILRADIAAAQMQDAMIQGLEDSKRDEKRKLEEAKREAQALTDVPDLSPDVE